jgi:hypothetical protein
MIDALSDLIAKGNYYHDACAICEIAEPTLYQWINLADKDREQGLDETQSIYIRLTKSIQKARAQSRSEFVKVIRDAAVVKREWLPAITYLERTDPDHWGRKDRTQVDVTEHKEIKITHVEVIMTEAGAAGEVVAGEYKELEEGKKDDGV